MREIGKKRREERRKKEERKEERKKKKKKKKEEGKTKVWIFVRICIGILVWRFGIPLFV